MFAEDLKAEFLERASIILDMDNLTKAEKISAIGRLFVEFEKKNKALFKANIPVPIKARRKPTTYNLFIKEKMAETTDDVIPSKERFRMASILWKNA